MKLPFSIAGRMLGVVFSLVDFILEIHVKMMTLELGIQRGSKIIIENGVEI